jgi:hypothetical protein
MPKFWEVLHELKAGKAIKTGGVVFYNKNGDTWIASRDCRDVFRCDVAKLDQDAEVIDLPECLVPKVDFFEAMEALRAGKSVKSPIYGMTYSTGGTGLISSNQPDVNTYFSAREIQGDWIIL